MNTIQLLFLLKLLQLVGAIVNTIGFLTLFTFASLVPYRWPLIISGFVIIVLVEILTRMLLRKDGGPDALDQDDDENQLSV